MMRADRGLRLASTRVRHRSEPNEQIFAVVNFIKSCYQWIVTDEIKFQIFRYLILQLGFLEISFLGC